ncbi:uracil-DNA glycosylase [Pseudovibrio japonicus]|uniref:Type-5 uracil-DNA glycosylase n=1 Tax=Pseudovibrio japonicus TaxID=366534 RepID=A0ABQ3EFA3_9HYPH|nr:uracil-DNA glycosylase [Pseudovibrio japonicus]GHB36850.1 uracil-DNA glycosylase [Pseudovibrio japonicus]
MTTTKVRHAIEILHKPGTECLLCPRLVAYREELRGLHPGWHNAPVLDFGPVDASLIVVGLAPGHKGGNRTGIPFFGDFSGEMLNGALTASGFAQYTDAAAPGQGIDPLDVRITNVVKCMPPKNAPKPAEILNCRPFFLESLHVSDATRAVVAVGRTAHEELLKAFELRRKDHPFAHGLEVQLRSSLRMFSSFHCSQYNVNTRRITAEQFTNVFLRVQSYLKSL